MQQPGNSTIAIEGQIEPRFAQVLNGAEIGVGHQTEWTGLVAKLIQQCAEYCRERKAPEPTRKEELEYEDRGINDIFEAV